VRSRGVDTVWPPIVPATSPFDVDMATRPSPFPLPDP